MQDMKKGLNFKIIQAFGKCVSQTDIRETLILEIVKWLV
jgi:hypothetical protein